jgi:hypothetical protein
MDIPFALRAVKAVAAPLAKSTVRPYHPNWGLISEAAAVSVLLLSVK